MGINSARVADFIRARTQASKVEIQHANQLGGGAIQENYALDVRIEGGEWHGEHHWVMRTDAPSSVAVSHSRDQEFKLLVLAFKHGMAVPQPLWFCVDAPTAGRPFYLMQRLPGVADPRALTRCQQWSDRQRRHLMGALANELVTLHSIEVPAEGFEFLNHPGSHPALARVEQYRRYLDDLQATQPVLEWGLRWLELNAPTSDAVSLCHRDFRTGNIMIDGDRLAGILDWEFADFSHPLEDLGWFCARCWRFGVDRFEAGGIGNQEDFVRAYEQASDTVVDRQTLGYWQIMAEVRWAVIALQQTNRHLSGGEPSLELALTGYLVPEMEMNLITGIERFES